MKCPKCEENKKERKRYLEELKEDLMFYQIQLKTAKTEIFWIRQEIKNVKAKIDGKERGYDALLRME